MDFLISSNLSFYKEEPLASKFHLRDHVKQPQEFQDASNISGQGRYAQVTATRCQLQHFNAANMAVYCCLASTMTRNFKLKKDS